jgi:predicted transport protein
MRNQFIFIAIFIGTLYSQCDSYTSSECDSNSNCEWVEDIEIANCYNLSWSEQECLSNGCSYNCTNYYGCWCSGEYEINNSFCEEIEYISGDINGDSLINVLDIIEIINLILESEYSQVVDMNYDGNLNVLDVVLVVDIILGN